MNENQNIPKLRFDGFTEPWEERKLGELYVRAGSGGTPSSGDPGYYGGHIPFLGIADMDGRFITKTEKSLTDDGLSNSAAWIVPAGSISLAMYASVGKVGITCCDMATSQAFYNMVFDSTVTRDFVYSRLDRADCLSEWRSLISTGTQSNLNAQKVRDWAVAMPSLPEQHAIGSLFRELDDFITLQQRKYERLQHLKQALLRKMFPKPGEQVPELRFDGFTEPWKERKLGELSDEFEYGLNVPATGFDGNHKYLRITDIDNETHRFDMSNLTSPLADFEQCEQYRLREHDLLFARTGASVGKTYLYRPSDGLTYYAGFLIRAHIHDDVSSDFIFQSTLTERYQQFVTVTSQRSGQPGINAQEYSEFVIPVPSVSEQHAIGSFFSHMDSLITLYQRNYERLQHLKQALLQRMFV